MTSPTSRPTPFSSKSGRSRATCGCRTAVRPSLTRRACSLSLVSIMYQSFLVDGGGVKAINLNTHEAANILLELAGKALRSEVFVQATVPDDYAERRAAETNDAPEPFPAARSTLAFCGQSFVDFVAAG